MKTDIEKLKDWDFVLWPRGVKMYFLPIRYSQSLTEYKIGWPIRVSEMLHHTSYYGSEESNAKYIPIEIPTINDKLVYEAGIQLTTEELVKLYNHKKALTSQEILLKYKD